MDLIHTEYSEFYNMVKVGTIVPHVVLGASTEDTIGLLKREVEKLFRHAISREVPDLYIIVRLGWPEDDLKQCGVKNIRVFSSKQFSSYYIDVPYWFYESLDINALCRHVSDQFSSGYQTVSERLKKKGYRVDLRASEASLFSLRQWTEEKFGNHDTNSRIYRN